MDTAIERHNERVRRINEAAVTIAKASAMAVADVQLAFRIFGAQVQAFHGRPRPLDRIVARDLGVQVSRRRRQREKNLSRWLDRERRTQ